jgi:hypothetical protein
MWWSKAKYRSRYIIIFSIILVIFKTPTTDATRVSFNFQTFFIVIFFLDTRQNYVLVWICLNMAFSFRVIANEHQVHYVVSDA